MAYPAELTKGAGGGEGGSAAAADARLTSMQPPQSVQRGQRGARAVSSIVRMGELVFLREGPPRWSRIPMVQATVSALSCNGSVHVIVIVSWPMAVAPPLSPAPYAEAAPVTVHALSAAVRVAAAGSSSDPSPPPQANAMRKAPLWPAAYLMLSVTVSPSCAIPTPFEPYVFAPPHGVETEAAPLPGRVGGE